MRCPKCQYISFGSANRCRNCGYDFSLTEDDADPLDLPIQNGNEPVGPLADLPLAAPRAERDSSRSASTAPGRSGSSQGRSDLPLFSGGIPDDTPLVTPPAVPRVPLSVRRGAPVIARTRQQPSFEDELASETELRDSPEPEAYLSSRPPRTITLEPRDERPLETAGGGGRRTDAEAHAVESAPALARIAGGIIDLAILGAINAAVVYLTLRLSSLAAGDILLLPRLPMLAFLLLLNGGYLVLFTAAGGQTIGKMATGIRVVPVLDASSGSRVPFGTAVVRAAAYLASLLPAGLGFLPIIFSPDGRAIHDRLSDTRVVKA